MWNFFICGLILQSVPVLTYLIGSIPFSYILPKVVRGIDIRRVGTGNVGGSNAMREAGFFIGLIGGLLDFGKGVLASQIAVHHGSSVTLSLLAVVVGHSYPIFLKFHGGRGIAPALGVLLSLYPPGFVFFILVTLPGIFFGESALATFFAIILTPVFFKIFAPDFFKIVVCISLFLLFRRVSFVLRDVKTGRDPLLAFFNRLLFDAPEKEKFGTIFRR